MFRIGGTALTLVLLATLASCDRDTPTEPGEPLTASITDVRYERVKPLVGPDGSVVVSLFYALAPGDPYNRTSARLCVLERRGETTFVCVSRTFEGIPVGHEWSAYVTDTAVSGLPVARDVSLNGTRIRVEDYANGAETGRFRIDARGRVR